MVATDEPIVMLALVERRQLPNGWLLFSFQPCSSDDDDDQRELLPSTLFYTQDNEALYSNGSFDLCLGGEHCLPVDCC